VVYVDLNGREAIDLLEGFAEGSINLIFGGDLSGTETLSLQLKNPELAKRLQGEGGIYEKRNIAKRYSVNLRESSVAKEYVPGTNTKEQLKSLVTLGIPDAGEAIGNAAGAVTVGLDSTMPDEVRAQAHKDVGNAAPGVAATVGAAVVTHKVSKMSPAGKSGTIVEGQNNEVEIILNYKANPKHDKKEFETQAVEDQKEGLQSMSAGEIKRGIESYNENGRPSLANKTTSDYRKNNQPPAPALAVRHSPDCCLGNAGDKINGYGDSGVNSSIGSQNKTNQKQVYEAVKNAPEDAKVKVKVMIDGEEVY
jgi:uncharacterized protein YqeY